MVDDRTGTIIKSVADATALVLKMRHYLMFLMKEHFDFIVIPKGCVIVSDFIKHDMLRNYVYLYTDREISNKQVADLIISDTWESIATISGNDEELVKLDKAISKVEYISYKSYFFQVFALMEKFLASQE